MSEINELTENTVDPLKKLITLGVMQDYELAKQEEKAELEAAIVKASNEASSALANVKSELTTTINSTKEALQDEMSDLAGTLQDTIEGLTDEGVKLSKNLYTYANIGVVTTASASAPVKIGAKGEPLRDMFANIFGEQKDIDPTLSFTGISFAAKPTGENISGGEWGTLVSKKEQEIVLTITNSATTSFGYSYQENGEEKILEGVQTFYYPIEKCVSANGKEADVRIVLPKDKTATVSATYLKDTVTTSDVTTLYCDFDDNQQVKFTITLPAVRSVETGTITRYDKIYAYANLGAAKREKGLAEGTPIKVLSFFGETPPTGGDDLANTHAQLDKTRECTSGAYTVGKGTKYNYRTVTSSTDIPTSATSMGTSTEATIPTENNTYIWFLMPTGGTRTIQQYAMNQWNNMATTYAGTVEFKPNSIAGSEEDPVIYYAYRTDKLMSANEKYKIS